jgi:hypothetical protein
MSFKYRTIGYSPEYAVTTGNLFNEFHSNSNFESGSVNTHKLGATTTYDTGSLLRITDAPTNTLDATNKLYVDTGLALKFDKVGGTITGATILTHNFTQTGAYTLSTGTGAVSLNGDTTIAATKTLTLAIDPASAMQAVTKQYADTKLSLAGVQSSLGIAAGTMTGQLMLSSTASQTIKYGTYTQSAYVITVTTGSNHGFVTGRYLKFEFSGAASSDNGDYKITYISPTSFSITVPTSRTVSPAEDVSMTDPDLQAATKEYVDAKLGKFQAGDGLFVEQSLVAASQVAYDWDDTTCTITSTNHSLVDGTLLNINFTTGTGADGNYTITVVDSDTFTITGTSLTTSGLADYVATGLYINQVSIRSPLDTLDVDADDLDLKTIHANNLFLGGGAYSGSTWYNQCKIDQWGRVTAAQNSPLVASNNGFYNKIHVQGGYITSATSEPYLIENQTINVSGDVSGSGTTGLTLTLNTVNSSPGVFTKVTVNNKGLVTSGAQLSASDISNALGFLPRQESDIQFSHFKGYVVGSSYGTSPTSLNFVDGSLNGYTLSGTYLYVPRGIYHITFSGSNNFWQSYYNNWYYSDYWWGNYWNYYYEPAVIYLNGSATAAAFSNYGGWWWYWNSRWSSDISQDYCVSDTLNVVADGSYLQFGLPFLSGVGYWYNIKIVKLK